MYSFQSIIIFIIFDFLPSLPKLPSYQFPVQNFHKFHIHTGYNYRDVDESVNIKICSYAEYVVIVKRMCSYTTFSRNIDINNGELTCVQVSSKDSESSHL